MSSTKSGKGGTKRKKRCNAPKKEESTSCDSGESSRDRGATIDPFRSLKAFEEGAKNMTDHDWVGACNGLVHQSMEIAMDINEMAREEELCEECGNEALTLGTLAAIQIQKGEKATQEYARRLLKASSDLQVEREEKKEIVSKSLRIGEELQKRLKKAEEKIDELEGQRDRYYEGLVTKSKEEVKWCEERVQLLTTMEEMEERLAAALATIEEAEREKRTTPPPPSNRRSPWTSRR